MSSPYHKAYFLLSAEKSTQFPLDEGIEIAIVGRSNAGKSSVLNVITQQPKLARVSKTPGRTRQINFFRLDNKRRLVDLPGYGYAKVPGAMKTAWEKTIGAYMQARSSLKGLIVVMDSRHPLRPHDKQLLDFCEHHHLPVHILLNKADKLSKRERIDLPKKMEWALTAYTNEISLQTFSALKHMGIKELQSLLNIWYQYASQSN